jgi:hypothetical protein
MRIGTLKSLIIVLTASLIGGCGHSAYQTSEIKPGEPDYPAKNPTPTHLIQFTAKIPATLSVEFAAGYRASANAGSGISSGIACQREVGLGVSSPLSLSVPIDLTRSGDSYRGTFAIDWFQPGRCDWGFQGLGYALQNAWPQGGAIAFIGGRSAGQGEGISAVEMRVDVWCVKDPKAPDPVHPERCAGLQQIKNGFSVPDIVSRIPPAERGDNVPVTLTSDIRVLTVHFHDLDDLSNDTSD